MSIPNRQIGWSNESNLLWYISSELEQIICQAACCTTTSTSSTSSTTTTTTTLPPCAVYSVYSPTPGAYVRYIDCTTGEYVFAGPLDGDATTYYCAKRDSVSFTFGVGTIEEVTSPCPTPSYTCTSYTVTAITDITFEEVNCLSGEIETVIKGEGWIDTRCARTGGIVITSGTATVVNEGGCGITCIQYNISGTGEIAFLNCRGGISFETFNGDLGAILCATEGSIVVTSGNLIIEATGECL